jgi:hypothetical protein
MPVIDLYEEIAKWAIWRYDIDPGEARFYCQDAPGMKIVRYLLECYFYGRDEELSYSDRGAPGLEKPAGLTYSQAHKIGNQLTALLPIFVKAIQGDAEAQEQVKMIREVRRCLPDPKIKKFFDVRIRRQASLARAFDIIGWMGQIAGAVTLLHKNTDILKGVVKLLPEDRARVPQQIYERVKAVYKSRNNTLISLAIGVYRKELEREGINFSLEMLGSRP